MPVDSQIAIKTTELVKSLSAVSGFLAIPSTALEATHPSAIAGAIEPIAIQIPAAKYFAAIGSIKFEKLVNKFKHEQVARENYPE